MLKADTLKNILIRLSWFLEVILIVAVFCLIFIMAHRALFDLDIWLHLKTGEYIVQNRVIPTQDIFSFTMPSKPWTDHSWLFQVATYLAYNRWQADGLIFLECLLVVLSFFVLFLIGYRTLDAYLEVGLLLSATALGCISRFNIRPDLLSALFFVLYLCLLRFHIDKKALWLLVPVQVLWVNVHGYFFLGPLLVLLFILADFLASKLAFLPQRMRENSLLSEEALGRLKVLFLAVLLASFLNPRGLRGAAYPLFVAWEALTGRMQIFLRYVLELQPTLAFARRPGNFYYILGGLSIFSMALNFRRLKIVDALLFLLFLLFSQTLRNIVFFMFACNIIIVSNMEPLLSNIAQKLGGLKDSRQKLYLIFRCLASLVILLWLGLKVDRSLSQSYYDFDSMETKSALEGIDQRSYPKKGVDFVLEHHLAGNMFNDFNSGAYLIGRVFPQHRVFIDGRTEFYGPEFFKEYMDAMKKDVSAFEALERRYGITGVFVSMALTGPADLLSYLYHNPRWRLVYLDESAVIFLKEVPENRPLIKEYAMDLNKYIVPRLDLQKLHLKSVYPTPNMKRASLFDLFEEDALVIQECLEALRIMPNCAQAFYLTAKVHMRKGNYQEAFQNLRSCLLYVPGHLDALVALGVCYQELKETELAVKTLKKAIRIGKKFPTAYYRLGCLYLSERDENQAIALIKKAVQYDPEDPKNYYKLAEALYLKQEKSKDSSYLRQAQLNLSKARELNLRFQDKELDKTMEDFSKKIAARPGSSRR